MTTLGVTGWGGSSTFNCEFSQLVLADAPVGYWRHEAGALSMDMSGNGNDATTTTDVAETPGLACGGSAGDYNGVTSHQLIPPDTTIDNLGYVSASVGKQFTLEFLVYLPSLRSDVLFSKDYKWEDGGANANGGWEVYTQVDGHLVFAAPTNGVTTLRAISASTLSATDWHHVVIIGQGGRDSDQCAFYIDGVLEEHNSGMTEPGVGASGLFVDTANDFRIGCGTDDPTGALLNFFQGYLDEVALYNKRLSSGRILSHALTLGFPYPHAYVAEVLQDTPIAYYRHEGDSVNHIVGDDWTAHSNTATPSGTLNSIAGIIGDAADYTAGPYQLAPNLAGVNQDLALGSNVFTVEAIVKVDSLTTARGIAAKGVSASTSGWCVFINTTGLLEAQVNYGTTRGIFRSPAGSIVINTWYHVVAVCQGDATSSTGIRKMYINNVSQTLTHISDPVGSQASDSARSLVLGARRNSADGAYDILMDGKMDELAIYNRELSAAEVAAHFALTGL